MKNRGEGRRGVNKSKREKNHNSKGVKWGGNQARNNVLGGLARTGDGHCGGESEGDNTWAGGRNAMRTLFMVWLIHGTIIFAYALNQREGNGRGT